MISFLSGVQLLIEIVSKHANKRQGITVLLTVRIHGSRVLQLLEVKWVDGPESKFAPKGEKDVVRVEGRRKGGESEQEHL